MGVFFRPRFPAVWKQNNPDLWKLFAKEMDANKNKYSFSGPLRKGKEFPYWRWWTWFVSMPLYKDFIKKLFIVHYDERWLSEDGHYWGNTIWTRIYKDFTMTECNELFNELKQLITDDPEIDWETDKEFLSNLKQSLKYILFSKFNDYEAY